MQFSLSSNIIERFLVVFSESLEQDLSKYYFEFYLAFWELAKQCFEKKTISGDIFETKVAEIKLFMCTNIKTNKSAILIEIQCITSAEFKR